jgi:FkbM family methyltransferase
MTASSGEVLLLRIFQDLKRLRENLPLDLTWKLTERRIIRTRIQRPDPVILDVGSNLGSSIAYYRGMFPKAFIIGFEPDPDTFRHLQDRFRRDTNTRLFNKGVGARQGKRQLRRFALSATNSLHDLDTNSEWVNSAPMMRSIPSVDVELTTLDDIAAELSLDRIDYMKSDTQGHEPDVLAGAQKLLADQRIKLMKLEVMPGDFYVRRVSLFELERILYPLGYELLAINDMHVDQKAAIKYFDAFFSAG